MRDIIDESSWHEPKSWRFRAEIGVQPFINCLIQIECPSKPVEPSVNKNIAIRDGKACNLT